MAVKEVRLNGNTIMTVADTTATESDVAYGKVFYKSNGDRSVGTNQGSSTIENGFRVENNDSLSYNEYLSYDDDTGCSYIITYDSQYQGTQLINDYQNCVTIGSKNKTYTVLLCFYNNSVQESAEWMSTSVRGENYKIVLSVNDNENTVDRVFYATPTITYLDTENNQLTAEQVGTTYSDKMFRLESFTVTRYTQQEAEQFMIDNNVVYSDEYERQQKLDEIQNVLAKSQGLVFKEVYPEHEHTYVCINSTAPTCTNEGFNTLECTKCHEQTTEIIPATGHTYGEWEIVENATQEKEGLKQRTCSVCGNMEEEIIPKL